MNGDNSGGEFRKAWTVLLAAAVGVGLGTTGLPIYTTGQFILPLSNAFGWSRAVIAGGLACLTAVSVITAPFIGHLIERFGPRLVAVIGLLGMAVGYICLTMHGGSIIGYYAAWMVLAVLGAGTSPNVWTRVVASWFDQHRGLALGITLCGTGIVAIVGPTAVGAVIATHGWQSGFLTLAAAQIVIALPLVLLFFHTRTPGRNAASPRGPQERPDTRTSEENGFDQFVSSRRQFWQIIVAFFLIAIVVAGMIVHLPAMLADFGIPRAQAGEALGLLGIAVLCGRLGIGVLMDRLPARIVAPIFIVLPVGSCWLLLHGSGIKTAILLCGLSTGAEVDVLAYLVSRYFGIRHYSRFYGWGLSAFSAGAGIGPVAAGWVRDTSGTYAAALYGFTVLMVIGAGLIAGLGAPPLRFDSENEAAEVRNARAAVPGRLGR